MSADVLLADNSPAPSVSPAVITSPSSSGHESDTANTNNDVGSKVISDFVQLTKPRIVVMILITTIMTGIIGGGGLGSIVDMFWLLFATGLVASSAGAANQIWERVIDARMARTANRPIPSGRMSVLPAMAFTALLGSIGMVMLSLMFGLWPAVAGAATWLMYVLIYTPMKTRTSWNTTVGAVAGALPVLIGYTALGGEITDAAGWLLFGVMVAWQYPHFMSIAWMYRRQYGEAGFCMTTTVDPTGKSAAIQSIVGSGALIACGVALCWILAGTVFAIIGTLGVVLATYPMLKASAVFANDPTDTTARKLLRSSLLVLPAVLAIATIGVFC